MAATVRELRDWLKGMDANRLIAIDDGGLVLVAVDDPETYWEIGGLPRDDDDDGDA